MAKVGRNDPCPCGSGKKYKKCCAGKSAQPTLREAGANAKAMARKWLGSWAGEDTPEGDLRLILDKFTVENPESLGALKKMGKVSGETVLFYQGKRWIGEADFSVEGALVLTTAETEHADSLTERLSGLPGVRHQDRQEDVFQKLTDQERREAAEGMIDFKLKFYTLWLDEANDRLDGHSPRQAAADKSLKPKLLALLAELEKSEAKLPKKERYNFKTLRQELGL